MKIRVFISQSALKRTVVAQRAATKAFPKTAALIDKLNEKIKLLRKTALKNYLARKKADAKAKAEREAKQRAHKKTPGHKSHSYFISEDMLESMSNLTDAELLECCSAVSKDTARVKKAGEKHLEKTLKNPKIELRRKRMAAAMRIRENKKLRDEIKKLLEMKKKLQDKAWSLYVAKKKEGEGPRSKASPSSKAKTSEQRAEPADLGGKYR